MESMVRVSTLFFDMNSYFASVAQQEEPALIGRPVGVLTTDSAGAACIAASIEAKRRGVRMGTRKAEARRLCPGIVFRAARHDVCVRYHHRIRAAAERVIPIEQAHSVDEFSCRLSGRQQDLDAALEIAARLQDAILRDVGPAMRCSVGVAPNRLLAKIAAELEKPAGINWLHPAILPGAIACLELDDIPGISRRMLHRLHAAGIASVPQLHALPPRHARQIWGNVAGERLVRALRGETVATPDATADKSIGHGQVLTGANRSAEGARLVARRLLVKAAARMRRQGLLARSLHVGAKCAVHGRLGQSGRIRATQDSFFLLDTFQRYWQALPLQSPVSVNVMLGGLVRPQDHAPDLFEAATTARGRAVLCHMLDALNRRYGQDTVHIGQLPPHRVPYTGAKIAFGRIPDWEDFLE